MKKSLILAIGVVGFVISSCTITNPVTATNNPIGDKVGMSETTCLFGWGGISSGIVLNKEYGIVDAAKNGNIDKIATVDLKTKRILFIAKHTLIVTGE